MADDRTYDIFAGEPDKDPIWMCSVTGLEEALQHMREIAATKPASYFVFSTYLDKVVGSLVPEPSDPAAPDNIA